MEIITRVVYASLYALFTIFFLIIAASVVIYFIVRLIQKKSIIDEIKANVDGNNLAFLLVRMPTTNDKKEEAFESFLKVIHRVLPRKATVSFELNSFNKFLNFYIVVTEQYKQVIESQLYAQYPDVEIEETTDYLSPQQQENAVFADIELKRMSAYPLRTHHSMEDNLLRNIIAFVARIGADEQFFLQFPLKRMGTKFWKRGVRGMLFEMFSGKNKDDSTPMASHVKLSSRYIFTGRLRLGFSSASEQKSREKLRMVYSFLKQLKSANEIKEGKMYLLGLHNPKTMEVRARTVSKNYFFIPEEIATIYHFPYEGGDVSSIVQTRSKKAPPSDILPKAGSVEPKNISLIGETNYRNEKIKFGIKRIDRRRHVYVVGKTGAGKSKLLELLMKEDIKDNRGFCLIDPHGDLAKEVLSHVPKSKIKDIVYVNPTDKDFPIPFNPLEYTRDYEKRQQVAVFFISIFKKIFAADWNERMEHILRFIILALLETKDSNILGVTRILTDTKYRTRVIGEIQDPVVKAFWANEYASWNEQFSSQAIVPILNKVGQFLANPIVRNMVGQRKNNLDFEKFMNEGKIVIINLVKGNLGDDNMTLLGSMLITKIQQVTLARAKLPENERRDFYFYIDEFQNFATEAFKSILSESRKYHLDLTIAHQYISQLPDDIKSSVFGNVGSIIVFAVGGDDASYLSKEFAPVFSPDDMISLEAREMFVKMSVDGKMTKPFSARTLTVTPSETNYTSEIVDYSRSKYAENRVAVERDIERWTSTDISSAVAARNEDFPEPIV